MNVVTCHVLFLERFFFKEETLKSIHMHVSSHIKRKAKSYMFD